MGQIKISNLLVVPDIKVWLKVYIEMKLELCNFSGYKIYPGHGKRFIRIDGKLFNFLSKKSQRSFMMKRNPRKISWTVLYRKKHKKGTQEEISKKRTRRTVKFQRAIQGASLEAILAKRNMEPEVREAQRDQAIKAAKDKAKAVKNEKKQLQKKAGGAPKKVQQKPFNKNVSKGAARVGGKR